MGTVLPFKPNARTIMRLARQQVEKLEGLQGRYANEMYRITRGFDSNQLNQIPEYREMYDEGFDEI